MFLESWRDVCCLQMELVAYDVIMYVHDVLGAQSFIHFINFHKNVCFVIQQ